MQNKFQSIIRRLPYLLNKLLEISPVKPNHLPSDVPLKGIYLFTEGSTHLYVGRTNTLRRRIQQHYRPSSGHNQATFAFRIARKQTHFKIATYKTKDSRKEIEKRPMFKRAFIKSKKRVYNMKVRYVEVRDPVIQSLFEIYVALVLETPYNDFENH